MSDPRNFSRAAMLVLALFALLALSGIASAAPSIILSKKSGPPTSQILVSGKGFEPNAGVDIYFGARDEALVVTNTKGEFERARAYAPRSARPGQHWVTALERNNDKGAQEPFLVQTDWSQFHFDADGTRLNPYENVLNPKNVGHLELKWSYATGGPIYYSPAVVNGVVYIASYDNKLYALDARSGTKLWSYSAGNWLSSSPAIANGVVYFGSSDNNLYALNASTGAKLWSYTTGGLVWSEPVVADGVVYFGSTDGKVYALTARTGTLLWSFAADSFANAAQLAVANGVAYVGSYGGYLYALNAVTGQELWSTPILGGVLSPPAVANGLVYFGADDITDNVYAVNASDGSILWENADCSEDLQASPAVVDGVVYAYCDNNVLHALNADTGSELWQYDTGRNGDAPFFSPAVANGVIYARVGPYSMGALDARDGSVLWSYLSDSFFDDPVVANGVVHVGSVDYHMYAFSLKYGHDEASPSNRPKLTALRPDLSDKVSHVPRAAPH